MPRADDLVVMTSLRSKLIEEDHVNADGSVRSYNGFTVITGMPLVLASASEMGTPFE